MWDQLSNQVLPKEPQAGALLTTLISFLSITME